MKDGFDCQKAMDVIFDLSEGGDLSLLQKLRLRVHLLFCPRCESEYRQLLVCKDMLQSEFFPQSPSFEDSVMEKLSDENWHNEIPDAVAEIPGGFSFRSWVIIGLLILVSMTILFFEMDFIALVSGPGASFLIPFGITIGIILTGYGALFIGTHLRELSDRFNIN